MQPVRCYDKDQPQKYKYRPTTLKSLQRNLQALHKIADVYPTYIIGIQLTSCVTILRYLRMQQAQAARNATTFIANLKQSIVRLVICNTSEDVETYAAWDYIEQHEQHFCTIE